MLRLILTLLFAGTGVALAQPDPDLPQPDPPGAWRKITHDCATTDSKCIGNPVTPLCAIETYFACFLRREPDYCDIVEAGVRPSPQVGRTQDAHDEYRIVYARRPSPLDPLDPATEGTARWLPGDVIIGFMRRPCIKLHTGDYNCAIGVESDPLFVHIVRKQGDHWVYVSRFRPRF